MGANHATHRPTHRCQQNQKYKQNVFNLAQMARKVEASATIEDIPALNENQDAAPRH